ncbi:MAG TPA: hypothetical protein VMC43_03470 [Candidatus Paceibacterota bacterium]|nr:hypothetical protein [Candidatus Paceibacterota bacterium]
MKAIRPGIKLIRTLVRDRIYYPGRLVVDTATMVARCGVLLLLYSYVFRLNGGTISNTTFTIAAWSMFFYFSFSILRLRDLSQAIMRDVQSGNVEVLLNKPMSYLAYRMWWQLGAGLYQFGLISVLGALVLAFSIGLPATMSAAVFLPTMIAVVGLGILLSLSLYAVVGLLAFWVEDITPIYWIVDKAVMLLGGSYLPVALFPAFMYKIALWSPFGASQFITHTVYPTWAGEWPLKLGIQAMWVVLCAGLATLLFLSAKQKVSVNGG